MAESKRFERDPAEGSRSTADRQLRDQQRKADENRRSARVADKPAGRRESDGETSDAGDLD